LLLILTDLYLFYSVVYASPAKRFGFADRATLLLPFMADDPTRKPFSFSKNLGGGSFKKYAKGLFWRGVSALKRTGGGASFASCPLFSTSHLILSVGFC